MTVLSAAIYKDEGVNDFTLEAAVNALRRYNVEVDCLSADDVLGGALKGSDLFVMPGGADEPYHAKLGNEGAGVIRDYVAKGGAYLGLCAGAYYACERFEFNKGLESEICRTRPLKLFRGWAKGSILQFAPPYDETLESAAMVPLAAPSGEQDSCTSYYHGGPVFMEVEQDENAVILGVYPDLPANQNAAIIFKPYGSGRVILSSPHIEVTADDFSKRLKRENNPQAYINILNDLEALATAREAFFQKILGLLLPRSLKS